MTTDDLEEYDEYVNVEELIQWFNEIVKTKYKHLNWLQSAKGSIEEKKRSLKSSILFGTKTPYEPFEFISFSMCPVRAMGKTYPSIIVLLKETNPDVFEHSQSKLYKSLYEIREAIICDEEWRGIKITDARKHDGPWSDRFIGFSKEGIEYSDAEKQKHPKSKTTWVYRDGKPLRVFSSQRKAALFLDVHPDYIRKAIISKTPICGYEIRAKDDGKLSDTI